MELGDAIADVIYYLIGTALEYGIPLDKIWDAVQYANISKLWTREQVSNESGRDGTILNGWKVVKADEAVVHNGLEPYYIVYDETGKVKKPPSWKEPDIVGIITAACATRRSGPSE